MASSPLISIIMAAYNSEKYIGETLKSVCAQSFRNWELLVINDCSTDATQAIVETFALQDPRIELVNLDNNMGAPAGPRNIGVRMAQGDWVAIVDSDDIWHPLKLELQLKALDSYNARFCSTQMRDFSDGRTLNLAADNTPSVEWISFRRQLIKFRTSTSSVLLDRELLRKYPFNESIKYKAREDLDCWLHCHEYLGRSIKISSPLTGYRIIDGQISGNKWRMFKRHYYVLRNYRYLSGRRMSAPEALLFTFSHFSLALYLRSWRHRL